MKGLKRKASGGRFLGDKRTSKRSVNSCKKSFATAGSIDDFGVCSERQKAIRFS